MGANTNTNANIYYRCNCGEEIPVSLGTGWSPRKDAKPEVVSPILNLESLPENLRLAAAKIAPSTFLRATCPKC